MQPPLRIVVEEEVDRMALAAVFGNEVASGQVEILAGEGRSGAISLAELLLLQDPERPVALVLDADRDDPERLLTSARNILARIGDGDWHVAVAVPGLEQWFASVPDLKSAIESRSMTAGLAVLGKARVNRDSLRQVSKEFSEFDDFVRSELAALQTANGVPAT